MGIGFGETHNHNYALHYIGVASRYFPLSQLINHQYCIAVKLFLITSVGASGIFLQGVPNILEFLAGGAKYPTVMGVSVFLKGC